MDHRTYFEEIGAWPSGVEGKAHRMLPTYIAGFIGSLLLTLAAYILATTHLLTMVPLIIALVVLAVSQFIVQLLAFLHLGFETSERERLVILGCTVFIVAILVTGSLWIMFFLNVRMMPSESQMDQYMSSQSGL